MWSWIKSAVAFTKMPAGARKGGSQPDAPGETDVGAVAEDAGPVGIEIRPERRISVEPESHISTEPEIQISVEPESPISVETENRIAVEPENRSSVEPQSRSNVESAGSTSPEEIDRRRAIVRGFFNDYWSSVEDKPTSFAERLDRAEGYINERVAAGGEDWRLDPATRKQLGLPASKKA